MEMLKRTFLLLFLLMLTQQAFAQTSYGIKGGFNWVTLDVNSEETMYEKWGYAYRPAFHVGVYGKYNLSDRLSINPEVLFSQKGYIYDKTSEGPVAFEHLNYLNLPVMAGLQVFKRVDLLFGPEVGFLRNQGEYYKKLDFGYAVGANFQVSQKIYLGFRYSHGLTSVVDTEKRQLPTNDKVDFQNKAYQFSIGYRLK
jgi:hypothetical protein